MHVGGHTHAYIHAHGCGRVREMYMCTVVVDTAVEMEAKASLTYSPHMPYCFLYVCHIHITSNSKHPSAFPFIILKFCSVKLAESL